MNVSEKLMWNFNSVLQNFDNKFRKISKQILTIIVDINIRQFRNTRVPTFYKIDYR